MPPPAADGDAAAAYVYGVVPAGPASSRALTGVEGVAPSRGVDVVEHEGLAALVSVVSLAEFGEEALAGRLQDAAWVASRARAHGHVLERALAAGAVVPFRFGAIFRGRDEVAAMLASRGAELREQLDRLRGKVELGVKAFASAELAERVSAASPQLRRLAGELEGEAPGRRYLLEKRLERLVAEEAAAARAEIAEESHAALAAVAAAAVANPPQDAALSGAEGEMLLNGAYLLDADARDLLATEVERLQGRFGDLGVRFELTGPWPPFNFVEAEGA